MDPAQALALADRDPNQSDHTPAPAVAAWLLHPADEKLKPPSQAQALALELGIDDLDNYHPEQAQRVEGPASVHQTPSPRRRSRGV